MFRLIIINKSCHPLPLFCPIITAEHWRCYKTDSMAPAAPDAVWSIPICCRLLCPLDISRLSPLVLASGLTDLCVTRLYSIATINLRCYRCRRFNNLCRRELTVSRELLLVNFAMTIELLFPYGKYW